MRKVIHGVTHDVITFKLGPLRACLPDNTQVSIPHFEQRGNLTAGISMRVKLINQASMPSPSLRTLVVAGVMNVATHGIRDG